jgi:hypothetical protein
MQRPANRYVRIVPTRPRRQAQDGEGGAGVTDRRAFLGAVFAAVAAPAVARYAPPPGAANDSASAAETANPWDAVPMVRSIKSITILAASARRVVVHYTDQNGQHREYMTVWDGCNLTVQLGT